MLALRTSVLPSIYKTSYYLWQSNGLLLAIPIYITSLYIYFLFTHERSSTYSSTLINPNYISRYESCTPISLLVSFSTSLKYFLLITRLNYSTNYSSSCSRKITLELGLSQTSHICWKMLMSIFLPYLYENHSYASYIHPFVSQGSPIFVPR